MSNFIRLDVSSQQVTFTPDDFRDFSRRKELPEDGDFQVTVVNTSSSFASFQVELLPQAGDIEGSAQWYRVTPYVSAKKPPGDRTTFRVTLLKSPLPRYDVTIPILVRAYSIELDNLLAETTVLLRIVRPNRTLHAYLPFDELTVYPGEKLLIPTLVYNLNPQARQITLDLTGIDPQWFPEGTQKIVQVDAGDSLEEVFACAPPPVAESRHQVYDMLLEITDERGNHNSARGRVKVLPFGAVRLAGSEYQQWVPSSWRSHQRMGATTFNLTLRNNSNLPLRAATTVTTDRQDHLTIQPIDPILLELNESKPLDVKVQVNRPWSGPPRTRFVRATPELTYPGSGEPVGQVVVQPSDQILELNIRPMIPWLVQLGGGLLGLLLLWLAWLLHPPAGHRAPVNALTLMANGTEVVSGSSDRTLKRWQVRQDSWRPAVRQIQPEGVLQDPEQPINKAVRTLKHLPKDVEQVAAGLENGEIQIWNISPSGFEKRFYEAGKPDRVFALDFTSDSQSLFSGHGSGVVRRWNLQGDGDHNTPAQELSPPSAESFAVAALTVVEPPRSEPFVAIGGQFNRLMLWDWQRQRAYNLPYVWPSQTQGDFAPVFSRHSYVTALASADRAGLMASADNQGFITLWNLPPLLRCMESVSPRQAMPMNRQGPTEASTMKTDVFVDVDLDLVANDCPEVDEVITAQWQGSPSGQGVRSLALAENGCYLASGGDDGQVVLWSLAKGGTRAAGTGQPVVLQQLSAGVNGVDIHHTRQGNAEVVLVVNDTPDYRVQVHRRQVSGHDCN